MRRKKSNLDEMQEQELLKVEHNGCWIAFWGLLAAIIIQSILFGSQDCKTLAGEGIVFIVLSIYIAVACVRRGIWDRRFQMNAKTNLILSAAAALVTAESSSITSSSMAVPNFRMSCSRMDSMHW